MERRGEGFERERYVPGREPRREGLDRDVTESTPREEYGAMERGFSMRDLTHWSSIWAGFFVAISLIVLVGVLGIGLGLGFGSLPTTTPATVGTAGAIWGVITLIVAFFCAGWFAARCSSVAGSTVGLIQGVSVWAVTTAVLLVLGAFGLAGSLGFNMGTTGMTSGNVSMVAQGAAWGAFIALLLGLAAAAFGGWVGGLTSREMPFRR